MGLPAATKGKRQESLSGKIQAIVVGLILAIIGSLIGSSFAKDSLTNYTGFGMLAVGIAIFILGVSATAATSIKLRLAQAPQAPKVQRPKVLFYSVWTIGLAATLAALGFLLSDSFEATNIINQAGYKMLLGGAGVFVIGAFGLIVSTARTRREKAGEPRTPFSIKQPRVHHRGGLLIGLGIIVTVAGSVVAGSYAKETVMNYAGFGALLVGIAILSSGISGTVVDNLKNRWKLNEYCVGENEPRIMLGSIWAICIGAMLVIDGSLIASSYAKTTIMNYAGFGMLLAGTGVFVYGIFETARTSAMAAMGYLHNRRDPAACPPKAKERWSVKFNKTGKNLVKTTAVFNLAGVMTAMGLLFFSLWQLDMIVSGPVWWSGGGQGWSYAGPGPYADKYFQCFLWKTTIGQAYDTLFLLIFISFIILFASAFFWPKTKPKENIEEPKAVKV